LRQKLVSKRDDGNISLENNLNYVKLSNANCDEPLRTRYVNKPISIPHFQKYSVTNKVTKRI